MASRTSVTLRLPEPAEAGAKESILAQDLVVDGEITSLGPVDVRGAVAGHLQAPNILIALTGSIIGSASAHDMTIQGQITGMINAMNLMLP